MPFIPKVKNAYRFVAAVIGFLMIGVLPLNADSADKVLVAFEAQKDKEVATLLQGLLLSNDFDGLDKVQKTAPELFDSKYFTPDFVSKLTFQPFELYAVPGKAPLVPSKGEKANPNKKGTWQFDFWNLKQTFPRGLDFEFASTVEGDDEKATMLSALRSLPLEKITSARDYWWLVWKLIGLSESHLQRRDKALQYLYKKGIPFASPLPLSLGVPDYLIGKDALKAYDDAMGYRRRPSESESQAETRLAEVDRVIAAFQSIAVTGVFVGGRLGEYNTEQQCFPVSLEEKDSLDSANRNLGLSLKESEARVYVNKKDAPSFAKATFREWSFRATLKPDPSGEFSISNLQALTSAGPVTSDLVSCEFYGNFDKGKLTLVVKNLTPETEIAIVSKPGTVVAKGKGEQLVFPLTVSGFYQVVTTKGNHVLFAGNLHLDLGLAAVAVNYPKGRFAMSTTEVTREQYWAIMGTDSLASPDLPVTGDDIGKDDGRLAREMIFCNQLSLSQGLEPAYTLKETKGYDKVKYWSLDPMKSGWRLPTKEEWWFAATEGNTTSEDDLFQEEVMNETAWTIKNSGEVLHAVATKKPNKLGIYDMVGNVAEETTYETDSTFTDSRGITVEESGSFKTEGPSRPLKMKYSDIHDYSAVGFRIVRTLGPSE